MRDAISPNGRRPNAAGTGVMSRLPLNDQADYSPKPKMPSSRDNLGTYRRKRSASATPEPFGAETDSLETGHSDVSLSSSSMPRDACIGTSGWR